MKNWKKISDSENKFGHRTLIKRIFEMPDGRIDEFDLYKSGEAVCILALTEDNKVLLAKQFRPAQERMLSELPGGQVEKNEDPEQAAKRELLEETGCSGDFKFVCKTLQSAYDTLVRYNYVALNCKKIQEQQLDQNEYIEAIEMSLEDFRKHLFSGELTDAATGYVGLDFLKLL